MLLSHVEGEMIRQAIQDALGLSDREHFRKAYLAPALEQGLVEMTQPDKPNSRSQRYRLTSLGQRWLQAQTSTAHPVPPHP
jgi:ATP-dependent DNA helicase RecG